MKARLAMMEGACSHEVKVTHLGAGKYGCRVFTNGKLSQESVVEGRASIGPACRDMLRMEDKMGNFSKFASEARRRMWSKK